MAKDSHGEFGRVLREAGSPKRRRCRSCGRPLWGRGDVCRSRRCPEYSRIWAGDQRRKLFINLEAFAESGAQVLMSAVTAPGEPQLPWDRGHCATLGDHKCTGPIGCRVQAEAAEAWNRSAPDRWRRLHRRAYQETVKACGPGSIHLVARAWELQDRGVLHVHPVVPYGTAREKVGARHYLRLLAELSPQYGFGFVNSDRARVKSQSAQSAAAYLSSYFVTGRGRKAALWQSVRSPHMPRSIIYVSTRLTQKTGATMRTLRLNRALHHLWGARLPLDEVAAVGRLLQAFPGNVEIVRHAPGRGPPGLTAGDGAPTPGERAHA